MTLAVVCVQAQGLIGWLVRVVHTAMQQGCTMYFSVCLVMLASFA